MVIHNLAGRQCNLFTVKAVLFIVVQSSHMDNSGAGLSGSGFKMAEYYGCGSLHQLLRDDDG